MPIVPTKILTEADCEMRIRDALRGLQSPDLESLDRMRLEAAIDIWEYAKTQIIDGIILTLDAEERFGWWGQA
jgi:hypothetical protein